MAKRVVLDEFHLAIRIPANLPEDEARKVRRTVNANEFMRRLRKAFRAIVRSHPDLEAVSVSVRR